MPSSRTQGLLGVIAAAVITAGVTTSGLQLFTLNTDGTVDETARIEIGKPVLVNCTNTGGKANYSACYTQNPFTGTGIVRRLELHAEANPSNTPFDCGVVSALTSSGIQLRNNGGAGSGQALIASTGSVLVPPGWFVKCAAGRTPGTAFDAVMLTEFTQYHSR